MIIELRVTPEKGSLFKISFNMETGLITTVDNEGLINQEVVNGDNLPRYIKSTVNRVLDVWENQE